MIVADQGEVVRFLADPATHGGNAVQRVETHAAIVFLAGERAYKLKRAVYFPYMDLSTVAKRRAACEAEVRLNRRTAPTIYRGAVPICRAPGGGLRFGEGGAAVDWVVAMNRFDQATLFDRLAARGALSDALLAALVEAIAKFHDRAERRPDGGGAASMRRVLESNAIELGAAACLDQNRVAALMAASFALIDSHAALLDRRRAEGFVRHCHGDLHLRNIYLIGGRPTLFDAIEFDERFAVIDVLYDLAFLLMDLLHRQLGRAANLVFNRYLWRCEDVAGLALLPLFLSCRAAIRAHVGGAAADIHADPSAGAASAAEARAYLDLARALVAP
ncbi:MAG: hypothetical protein FJX53_14315, partial [Alphaproteobacteria bacterium]|nr:hypothetical protein [Alphaproteobacteria bacterium]